MLVSPASLYDVMSFPLALMAARLSLRMLLRAMKLTEE